MDSTSAARASCWVRVMEYEISNVVDPEFTIVAKMRKRFLGTGK